MNNKGCFPIDSIFPAFFIIAGIAAMILIIILLSIKNREYVRTYVRQLETEITVRRACPDGAPAALKSLRSLFDKFEAEGYEYTVEQFTAHSRKFIEVKASRPFENPGTGALGKTGGGE